MSRQRCGWRVLAGGAGIALSMALASPALSAEPVDVELVLAVDVSLSMSPDELDIQRNGYAAALTDQRVLDAIGSGYHGRIALSYVEWAGSNTQRIVVPWTIVATAEDARGVANSLLKTPPSSARRTSISSALEFSADMFAESPFRGLKRVIDVSGDGPNNQGAPVDIVRDQIAAQGIVINGLPLMTNGGMATPYDVAELDRYYADCVITGPGAFVIPVNDWSQFPEAIRRKLVLELAGPLSPLRAAEESAGPPVIRAQSASPYDCLVGEKLWRDRQWMFDSR